MKKNTFKKLYIVFTVISVSIFLMAMFFSYGHIFKEYFFYDDLDTGMDFFNSIIYTLGRHPYTQYGTIYPPLANFIFWFICHCVPRGVISQWPDSFEGSVAIRGSDVDLRVSQVPLFAYIFLIAIICVLFIFVLSHAFNNSKLGMMIGISMIFSFANLYSFERGNIIGLAVIFLLVFTIFYRSENKWIREIALVCLALSAGLKLYPALFGIILIAEKRWKDAIRAVIYGVLIFFVPFVIFDGVEGLRCLIEAIISFSSSGKAIRLDGYNVERTVSSIIAQIGNAFSKNYEAVIRNTSTLIFVIKTAVLLWLALAVFLLKEHWKKLLALSMIVIFAQDAGGYTLIFMIPAFIAFLNEEKYDRKSWLYFVCLSLINLLLPIFGRIEDVDLAYYVIVKQYAMLLTGVLLTYDLVLQIGSNWAKYKNKKKEKLPVCFK